MVPWVNPTQHQWAPLSPLKITLPMAIYTPIQCMIAWAHPSPKPKWHLDRFNRFCTDVPLLYNGPPLLPSKLLFPMGMWTASNTWLMVPWAMGPPQSTTTTASRSVQPFLQGLLDHSTRSVTIGHIYICSTAMQPNTTTTTTTSV